MKLMDKENLVSNIIVIAIFGFIIGAIVVIGLGAQDINSQKDSSMEQCLEANNDFATCNCWVHRRCPEESEPR